MTNVLRLGTSLELASVLFGSLSESALESPDEAGMMPIPDSMGNFLDGEVTNGKKLGCLLKPSFRHQAAELRAGLLLE